MGAAAGGPSADPGGPGCSIVIHDPRTKCPQLPLCSMGTYLMCCVFVSAFACLVFCCRTGARCSLPLCCGFILSALLCVCCCQLLLCSQAAMGPHACRAGPDHRTAGSPELGHSTEGPLKTKQQNQVAPFQNQRWATMPCGAPQLSRARLSTQPLELAQNRCQKRNKRAELPLGPTGWGLWVAGSDNRPNTL